jgi:hypothetical protein
MIANLERGKETPRLHVQAWTEVPGDQEYLCTVRDIDYPVNDSHWSLWISAQSLVCLKHGSPGWQEGRGTHTDVATSPEYSVIWNTKCHKVDLTADQPHSAVERDVSDFNWLASRYRVSWHGHPLRSVECDLHRVSNLRSPRSRTHDRQGDSDTEEFVKHKFSFLLVLV